MRLFTLLNGSEPSSVSPASKKISVEIVTGLIMKSLKVMKLFGEDYDIIDS
jgi:hypothetical protein